MKKLVIIVTAFAFMTSCAMIDPALTGKRVAVEPDGYYNEYYESPYYDYGPYTYANSWFPFGMGLWLSPFYWGFSWGPWYHPFYWSHFYSPYGWGSYYYPSYRYYYPWGSYYGGSRITKRQIQKGTVKSGTRRVIRRGSISSGRATTGTGSSGSRGSTSSRGSSSGSGTRVKKK